MTVLICALASTAVVCAAYHTVSSNAVRLSAEALLCTFSVKTIAVSFQNSTHRVDCISDLNLSHHQAQWVFVDLSQHC